MLGRFLNLNKNDENDKWKLKYFQITWAKVLFTIEHREHNKCLNWDIWHF